MTPKVSTKSLYPENIYFSENPKNIENQNLEPPKNDPSLRMYENIRPPLGIRGLNLLGVFNYT